MTARIGNPGFFGEEGMMKGEIIVAAGIALIVLMIAGRALASGYGSMRERKLGHGLLQIYDFGTIKLHAYQTEDPLHNECFLLETPDNLVGIEGPAFDCDIATWKEYIVSLNKPLTDILISFHPTGGRWYGDAKSHATANALRAMREGDTKARTHSLGKALAPGFDARISDIDSVIKAGFNTIGGIDFEIADAGDGYDIAIPAIKAVYTHMLGASTLCTLAGQNQIETVIGVVLSSLERIKAKGYPLVLSGHDTPKTLADVDSKIAFVKEMWNLTAKDGVKEDFMGRVKKAYPYTGLN